MAAQEKDVLIVSDAPSRTRGAAEPDSRSFAPNLGAEGATQSGGRNPGWLATLALDFEATPTRTILARRSHTGPLVVQRPFYPEGEVCHVYIVHPPGGVVGGDTLQFRAHAHNGAHALITTPAATKFYRSETRVAHQSQDITLDAASFEWLPQETILFPDSYANIATRVHLTDRSRFIGWEIVCYGRPASHLLYTSGEVNQDFELWVNDTPLLLDRLRIDGSSDVLRSRLGLNGYPCMGTMFAFPADDALLELARSVSSEGVVAACTKVDGALVCRATGAQADAVRKHLASIWALIRPSVVGRAASPPRIWST